MVKSDKLKLVKGLQNSVISIEKQLSYIKKVS